MIDSTSIYQPTVSILVPVKDGSQFLHASIASLIEQSFDDFEIVIVNDYSNNETVDILADIVKLDSRIKLYHNNGIPGLSNALNFGLKHAKGRYVARHDADDISVATRLKAQIEYLEMHPELDILGCNIEMIDASGAYIRHHQEPISHVAILFHTMFGTPFAHPTVVLRKAFLDKHAISYVDLPAQDYELWVRMLNAGAMAENLPDALVKYRVSPSSDSHARSSRHQLVADLIKSSQVSRFVDFSMQRKRILSPDYQLVAHFLLTGNVALLPRNANRIANNVIAFFSRFSQNNSLPKAQVSSLIDLMRNRQQQLHTLPQRNLVNHVVKSVIPLLKVRKSKPATHFALTASEIKSFVENVHVFVIVRDRVECLRSLITWLSQAGHKNITLINNASTYPPLLEFLGQTTYRVINLDKNLGHTALWQLPELLDIISANWFVYTDPDVIPTHDAPATAVGDFYNFLLNNQRYLKAGCALSIDDLPDHYHLKADVLRWEQQYYAQRVSADIFIADIDTTLALHRPGTEYCYGPAARFAGKYKARHLPWYANSLEPTAEEVYYREHALSAVTTWNVSGGVKALPLPTALGRLKSKLFALSSVHPWSYSVAKKIKAFLNK